MLNEDYFTVHSHRVATFLQYLLSNEFLILFHLQEQLVILEVSKYFAKVEQVGVWEQFAWAVLYAV